MGCADISPRKNTEYQDKNKVDIKAKTEEFKGSVAARESASYDNVVFSPAKEDESGRRSWLKDHKPLVHAKVQKFEEKLKRGESIAIVQFQYNYECNFKCEHCSIDKFQVTRKDEKTEGKRKFEIEDVRELSRQADEMGLANFVITGGEPLMFKDFDELVEAIDPSKFFIVTDSNGWLLDEAKAKHLKKIGVDKVQLSLDGIDAGQHDEFRRKDGSHERVLKAVEACKKAGLHVILSTVVWHDRVRSQEFEDYLQWAQDNEVGTYVSYAKPVGAYEGNYDQMVTTEDTVYMEEVLEKKYDVFTHLTPSYGLDMGCIAVKRMIPITRYGDVMPCPYTHVSLGNFFEEPLEKIVNRGLNIHWFDPTKKQPCLCGVKDNPFITEVVEKTYGVPVPVRYEEVFSKEDYIDQSKL